MYRVFIDSDVLLDVLAKRKEFYPAAAGVLSLAETKKIRAYTSPVVIANIFYILRKLESRSLALDSIKKLRFFINILPVSEIQIDKALASAFRDFEDAVQYFTSVDNNIDFIITRNKPDYKSGKSGKIVVCTPAEFLAMYYSRQA